MSVRVSSSGRSLEPDHRRAFETHVEEILLKRGGWKSGSNAEWDKERALFPAQGFAFIADTRQANPRTCNQQEISRCPGHGTRPVCDVT